MRRSIVLAVPLLVACVAAHPVHALTFAEIDVICPVDGKVFKTQVMSSGTSFGTFFDLKQTGPIASPPPLPVCPGNGFVVDPDREYSAADRARIADLVATAEFKSWLAKETPWYRFARQEQALGAKPEDIAMHLLSATWEAGPRYSRYANEAFTAMQARATKQAGRAEAYYARMLVGELQRRLGRFEDARSTFQSLQAEAGFPGQQGQEENDIMRKIVQAQLGLIQARDSSQARLDEDGKVVHF